MGEGRLLALHDPVETFCLQPVDVVLGELLHLCPVGTFVAQEVEHIALLQLDVVLGVGHGLPTIALHTDQGHGLVKADEKLPQPHVAHALDPIDGDGINLAALSVVHDLRQNCRGAGVQQFLRQKAGPDASSAYHPAALAEQVDHVLRMTLRNNLRRPFFAQADDAAVGGENHRVVRLGVGARVEHHDAPGLLEVRQGVWLRRGRRAIDEAYAWGAEGLLLHLVCQEDDAE